MLKRLLVLIALASIVTSARADLFMQQQANFGNPSNLVTITIRIHGDKIRQDVAGMESGDVSLIKDADTGESIALMHRQKIFTRPRAKAKDAQSPEAALSKPLDTGKADFVAGYDAEIYAWAADRKLWNDTNGMIETLWVVKAYPDYFKIRSDLAILDRANVSFPGKGMQPEISALPGMVVKSRLIVKIGEVLQTIDIKLISARQEAVDPSIFEVPDDYKEWNPPQPSGQPAQKRDN